MGPYQILDAIGAGGMGEVYRATDARLGRDVALKVVPEAFARDVERMVRFEREAKLLASLNHPNIASIYGLEESNGVRALVMELVEGPTLADRIKHTPIPFDEAMPIAKQIAEALEYAHEHGIIHRDLKPSNVKLTPDSQVKVLDFGLAKALEGETAEQELQNSPTLSAVATRTGVLLGTAAYMSPEQARGKRVDRRTDIWAFGCVLYEMLTGKSPFTGETISDTLAAVIRADPDWSELPPTTSLGIRQLFRRCLEKDPKLRLRDRRSTICHRRSSFRFTDRSGRAWCCADTVILAPGKAMGLTGVGTRSRGRRCWIDQLVFAPCSRAARGQPLRIRSLLPRGTIGCVGRLPTKRFSGCGYLSGWQRTRLRNWPRRDNANFFALNGPPGTTASGRHYQRHQPIFLAPMASGSGSSLTAS
jgi:Protein kinase domain